MGKSAIMDRRKTGSRTKKKQGTLKQNQGLPRPLFRSKFRPAQNCVLTDTHTRHLGELGKNTDIFEGHHSTDTALHCAGTTRPCKAVEHEKNCRNYMRPGESERVICGCYQVTSTISDVTLHHAVKCSHCHRIYCS